MSMLALLALSVAPAITFESLLADMTDLQRLTRPPAVGEKVHQASSYDRASTRPGEPSWFANADAGQYIRIEQKDGRMERVMAEFDGPGAILRIWSANPAGNLRFYFDGETSPRWTVPAAELLTGRTAPLSAPFAYVAARGCNLYLPIPYARSLKLTVDGADSDGAKHMYYHVNARTFPPGTVVQSFDPKLLDAARLEPVRKALTQPTPPRGALTASELRIAPGRSATVRVGALRRPMQIVELAITPRFAQTFAPVPWNDPLHPASVLRRTELQIAFDGTLSVAAPLGDFFGAPPFGSPYRTLATTIEPTGRMVCRFPMPFRKDAVVRLVNHNAAETIAKVEVRTALAPSDSLLTFHARWTRYTGSTRPMRDLNLVETIGPGRLVGAVMHVANPVPEWWGEGDEKIWVDREPFPSTFGTGTEDYFGYAWCCPERFEAPYHAQPVVGKPANLGQIANLRWHVFDDIPFRRHLKFDIEQWHWAVTEPEFATTAFWYGPLSPSGVRALSSKDLSTILETPEPKPVEGAIEGETMTVVGTPAGTVEKQGGFWQLSGGFQLWWRDAKAGDSLDLRFDVPKAGRFRVVGHFCHAPDYGRHAMSVNSQTLGEIDFYAPGLTWKKHTLGVVTLPAGPVTLNVQCFGTHPAARPARHMFGLDYLLLEPMP